jgi:Leucine rich repeat/Lipopolysaccharide kinase (Kdo/WaaP) family
VAHNAAPDTTQAIFMSHTLEQLRSGALAGTRRLDLSADLTHLPPEVYGLADTLEVLNLSGNRLTSLPHDLSRLHRLKVVFGSGNPFVCLPEVLGDCPALEMVGFKACRLTHVPGAALPPRLRWLTLTDNAIAQLPTELGQRPALQKLMLAGNALTELPASLADASHLELLRLSANRLSRLPAWLTELPRLAWLALSGNTLGWHHKAAPAQVALPTVPWGGLRLDGLLGEGASGHIHRVHRVDGRHGEPPWALKLFKGTVTSDGLPEHELAACVAAGPHPALCTPVATLAQHPQGQAGMLLPLVPDGFVPLAAPPSLESCTRDVYAPGLSLDPGLAQRLAWRVASAVTHLHARGVMHGDLYAHNTLWHPATGDAWLSDMGAASLLPANQPGLQRALTALEVLAFGHLLHELVALLPPGGAPQAWADLAAACVRPHPLERPDMAAVVAALKF